MNPKYTKEVMAVEGSKLDPNSFGVTALQARFAAEYIKDFDATKAIVRAGSNTGNPRQLGSQYKTNKKVKNFINALVTERGERSAVKPEFVISTIVRTIQRAENQDKPDNTAILRGCELLGRHLAMFVERQEITGKDGAAIQYEKIAEDAADFQSAIARLVERERKERSPSETIQ